MKEISVNDVTIRCGKETDSSEELERLCNAEAKKLLATIDVPEGCIVSVPCWTAGLGFPELIGIEKFSRDENGKIVYELDLSESTF